MSHRRALLALGGAGLLAGCGFRPLYGPDGERRAPATDPGLAAELATVRVALMPERFGQVMRRYLQRRLEGSRPGTPSRYILYVATTSEVEPLGFRQDGTATRVRTVMTANWSLTTDAIPPTLVDQGRERTLDAFNIPDLQFFAAEASREAMDRRLVEELGDRVVEAVALSLRRRQATPG
ncbi:LPS assembly lipoprotein LptE [Sabulicella glaciei]|uniref:LPS assembly lipoprotein LptE n=1 Tax=Sabulicella glaciei TaxID=2984948 RepID=A0ABT3NYC3_9PROT|nr:LPS assembly lipoprotein LptE [Roseococcus sp. MDT2-1-1]MCW8087162.1 LPS assembly lipoprotein LptE [Roseococcus sp. MDT2-1-1]